MLKKITILLSLSLSLNAAHADVGSALTDYYNSLQGNSKIERATLTTNGFTGGGYYQRGANVDLTLGYITPPSLKGGCGNIDFNMGAFSFISSDQIVEALKAIGQNAKALLFTEAIEIISASLSGNVKSWIDQANKWLGVLKNSCQASSMLAGGLNKSMGLCQNAARFNGGLSDENTVQSTCQAADQGMKQWKDMIGSNSGDSQEAKKALAPQIALQGGILQNILANYFVSAGRASEIQSDLGNLVLSTVGDVYINPIDKNTDNTKAQALPVAVKRSFPIANLLAFKIANAETQISDSNWKVFNCDFTWDKDNFRAKNVCFNEATDSYKVSDAKTVASLQKLIYTKIEKIHTSLTSNTGQITDSDLTVLSLADAPIFQLMQAGVDAGMDDFTYPLVEKYMDYTVHKIYYNIFDDVSSSINTQIAALNSSSDTQQLALLGQINDGVINAKSEISKQLTKDQQENKYDPMEVLQSLNIIRTQILKNVSPTLQQQLVYTSTNFRNN